MVMAFGQKRRPRVSGLFSIFFSGDQDGHNSGERYSLLRSTAIMMPIRKSFLWKQSIKRA